MNPVGNEITKNVSLKAYNTFSIDVNAEKLAIVSSETALMEVLQDHTSCKKFILGGGSNLLLTRELKGIVIINRIKGKKIILQPDSTALVEAGAGEVWHELVMWTIENQLGGIENLALIPGCAGAAPIQNIGAYGVEIKDLFHSCDAMAVDGSHSKTFFAADCGFGYRDSVFKNELKDRYVITRIRLQLTRENHKIHAGYGAIQTELDLNKISQPTPADIAQAVIKIRRSKLPDPEVLPNSGSFFKNPVVTDKQFTALQEKYPDLPAYPQKNGVKIPAGWLIEKAGYKGKKFGAVGVHDKQALVLVNFGNAKGIEVKELAEKIQQSIYQNFGVSLETEVNIW